MSSVVHPVGDQPPAVYWRRRLLFAGIGVLVAFFLFRACGGDDAAPVVDPSASPTATSTPSTPAATPSPTSAATTSAKPVLSASAVAACDPADVRVTAKVSDEQYPVGGPVPIRFVVTTTSDSDCTRDVGAAANTVTVASEGRRIWSSDDCTPGGDADVRRISASKPFAVTVTWQGDVSRPGCESPRPKAPAGSYDVAGRNGDVIGPKDSFTLG